MNQSEKAYKLALQGQEFFKQGKFNEAIKRWKEAASLYKQLSFTDNVYELYVNIAIALKHRAETNFQTNEFEDALKDYEDASSIFKHLNHIREHGECQLQLGNKHYYLGNFSMALDHFTLAKSLFLELEMSSQVASSEYLIGLCLLALSRNDEALIHQKNARSMIDSDEQPILAAQIESQLGLILCCYGKEMHSEAIEHIQISKKLNKKIKMPGAVASCEKMLGDIFLTDGNYGKSLEHFETAKSLWEDMVSKNENLDPTIESEIAVIETHIGIVLTAMEKYQEALSLFAKAEYVFFQQRLIPKIAWVQSNLSDCLFRQDNYLQAFKNAEKAMINYKKFGLLREQGFAYRDMGKALCKMEKFEEALPYLEKSLEMLDSLRGQTRQMNFKKSMKKDFLEIYDDLCLSHLVCHGETGNKEHLWKALNSVERSKCSTIAESLQDDDSLILCPEMEKLIDMEGKLLADAIKNVSEYEKLSQIHLKGNISKAQFRNSQLTLEQEYETIHEDITRLRHEILINCSDYGNISIPRTYNVIDRTIKIFPESEKWNILEFAVLSKMNLLVVFLINSDGSINYETKEISEEFHALLAQCRNIVLKMRDYDVKGANTKMKFLSIRLYETLVPHSIGKRLKERNITHLFVIPHSFLHWVPFEALFDGEQYWGIKYAISLNYSLDLARLCVEKRQRKTLKDSPRNPCFLIISNPLLDLNGSEKEVRKIVDLVNDSGFISQTLKEEQATQKLFIEVITKEPLDVIHYSGHACFMGKDPSLSCLYLHTDKECKACRGEAKNHTPKFLTAKEITTKVRFEGTPIIYLSGCETGVNEIEPGDEMFGLFRSFMLAGATSFVLSKWLVNDAIAVTLAETFYQSLFNGDSISSALQKARIKVFEQDSEMFIHWAAFSQQGDPFRTIS